MQKGHDVENVKLQVPIPITNSLISKKSLSLSVSNVLPSFLTYLKGYNTQKKVMKKCSVYYLHTVLQIISLRVQWVEKD